MPPAGERDGEGDWDRGADEAPQTARDELSLGGHLRLHPLFCKQNVTSDLTGGCAVVMRCILPLPQAEAAGRMDHAQAREPQLSRRHSAGAAARPFPTRINPRSCWKAHRHPSHTMRAACTHSTFSSSRQAIFSSEFFPHGPSHFAVDQPVPFGERVRLGPWTVETAAAPAVDPATGENRLLAPPITMWDVLSGARHAMCGVFSSAFLLLTAEKRA